MIRRDWKEGSDHPINTDWNSGDLGITRDRRSQTTPLINADCTDLDRVIVKNGKKAGALIGAGPVGVQQLSFLRTPDTRVLVRWSPCPEARCGGECRAAATGSGPVRTDRRRWPGPQRHHCR